MKKYESLVITRLVNIASQLLEEKDTERAIRLNSAIAVLSGALAATDENAQRLINISNKLIK